MQRTILLMVICTVCMALSMPGHAAGFIKFDGVDGEAEDADHRGWIDLSSFNQAISRSASAGSPTRVVLEDIVVVKELDKSSPKLAEAVATGKFFPTVEIHLTATYGDRSQTYYTYELKNVQVTSYSIGGSTRSEHRPTEQLSLNFEEIKVTYTEYDDKGAAKGNVEYSWKVEEGTK